MPRLLLTRALLAAATPMLCFAVIAGCEQLDPVKTDSLCNDRARVSMRCPQCQQKPYAAECSVCETDSAKDDPETCSPRETTTDPIGKAGNGGAGEDGAGPDGAVGEGGESGSQSGSQSGAGAGGAGSGAGDGASGSGGMSGNTGGAGGPAPSMWCTDDLWCSSREPAKPGCDVQNKVCVQCTRDDHCSGMLPFCNLAINRCQNCVADGDCGTRRCDEENKVCVDCEKDTDCTDPVNNNCDTRKHSCVDCVTNSGCLDQSVNGTCDPGMFKCVDCLDDVDCNEAGKRTCDKPNRVCVGCIANVNCIDSVLGSCDTTKQVCVDCVDDSGCSGAAPRCDTDEQKCVACLDDPDCASGHCVGQTCVECEADADCPDADASHCDTNTNVCVGCTASSQCGHLSATRACDTANRRCVECNDDTTCGGKACLRAKHECSDVNVGSVNVCLECEADSMCMTNMKCVPLSFGTTNYGSYCVFTRQSRAGGSCMAARPYTRSIMAQSVDSSTSTAYCTPITTTTCPAVLDVARGASGTICSDFDDCGIGEMDGQCSGGKCTYVCNGDSNNCPPALECLTGGSCG